MKRVLYVNHTAQMSGAEHSLLLLMSRLDPGRFVPALACPEGPLADSAVKLGIETRPVPLTWLRRVRNPLRILGQVAAWKRGALALGQVIDELQPVIVHSNGTGAHVYMARVLKSSSAWQNPGRCRVVWHVRDMRMPGSMGPFLARRADAAVAVSEAVQRFHRQYLAKVSLVRAIHNGVDLERFRPRLPSPGLREELSIQADAVVFACIGQAVAWKRHDLFLEAAARLQEVGDSRAWFVLVRHDPFGHGEPPPQVPADGRVTLLPGHADMPGLLSTVDVLVQPSENEPFGRTIIEAMASALPVIATDSGGPPEIVAHGETGLIVRTGSVTGLVGAMEQLVGDAELRRRMGQAGRQRAEALFGADRHVRAVEDLYTALSEAGDAP